MTDKPGTAGRRYSCEYMPGDLGRPHWRIADPDDKRLGTCYVEENARLIVDALNGNPPAVGARREGALQSDPYALAGFNFADLLDYSRDEITIDDHTKGTVWRRVRDRVLDDVHAAHQMLDALGVAGGSLVARIGLAMAGAVTFTQSPVEVHGDPDAIKTLTRQFIRPLGASPLVEPDSVHIPTPDALFKDLEGLTAEEMFRVFDRAMVLPADPDEVRSWILTEPADVQRMQYTCLRVALDSARLAQLNEAVQYVIARKGAR